MCWAAIFVGVLFGLTNRNDRVRPFHAAAAASLLYILVSYPSMVYIVQLYYEMDLNKDTICENYFNDGGQFSCGVNNEYELKLIPYCCCVQMQMLRSMGIHLTISRQFIVTLSVSQHGLE